MRAYAKLIRRHTGETSKAKSRRQVEGFFCKYCTGRGLDIGFGYDDLVTPKCRGWEYEDGNAQYLKGIPDNEFDFIYSSHTLEHLIDPAVALQNWWRVIKPGGYLILYIPHRDLFEKRTRLPSIWNNDHKHFFLLDRDDPPDTLGIIPLIERSLPDAAIIYAKECTQGYAITDPNLHSNGEYSIEVVVRKGC